MANGNQGLYCSATWKIDNYLNAPFEVDEIFESPEFETRFKVPMKWKFGITGRRREGEEFVTEFILRPISPTDKLQSTNVRVRIAVEIRQGNRSGASSSAGEIAHKNVWHEGKISFANPEGICLKNEKIFSNVKNDYTPDSDIATITITCDFIRDDPFDTNIDKHLCPLLDCLKTFFDCEKFRDLKLKVGSQTFPVHRAIVIARSSYVARILNKDPNLKEIDLTKKCSESQLKGLIKYWYTGVIEDLPRTLSTSNLGFLLNMQDVGLTRYIVPENIEIKTTFVIRDEESFEWDITTPYKDETMDEDETIDKDETTDEDELMETMDKYGDKTHQLFINPYIKSGNEYVSLHIKLKRGLEHLLYLEVYLKDRNRVEKVRRSTSQFNTDLKYEKCQFENIMTHEEFMDFQSKLSKRRRPLVACKAWRCGITHKISSVFGADISKDKNPYTILANDMKRLLESKAFSDFTLITKDKKSFNVHKAILVARGKYFRKLFEKKGENYKSHEMTVYDTKSMSVLLKLLYYAEVPEVKIQFPLLRIC